MYIYIEETLSPRFRIFLGQVQSLGCRVLSFDTWTLPWGSRPVHSTYMGPQCLPNSYVVPVGIVVAFFGKGGLEYPSSKRSCIGGS